MLPMILSQRARYSSKSMSYPPGLSWPWISPILPTSSHFLAPPPKLPLLFSLLLLLLLLPLYTLPFPSSILFHPLSLLLSPYLILPFYALSLFPYPPPHKRNNTWAFCPFPNAVFNSYADHSRIAAVYILVMPHQEAIVHLSSPLMSFSGL